MAKVNQSRIREALTAGTNVKEKGPPVADGILSVTPDTPEMLEWRSRSALDVAETSSTFLDDDDDGPKPHELYGKFTWKIENFSEISKRELRSNVFDVGNYKWYILVYPQGCDVCNHLSLFLCVADYDKLLPGWSHFAQFTIAVVNKEPKKSKYSDTLHRFCKKEHDWGWKKFMELSKVLDGFTVADTLVIKAQVQVILDKPSKPFRCLDPQYRRELVRVYLTNVEGICRRFCEDKKARLAWAREEVVSFRQFWGSLTPEQQRKYLTDKGEVILKAIVKQFFNEKEVTSTLVMDALYSGCKQIEEHSRQWLEGKCTDNAPVVLIKAERSTFMLCGDLIDIADRVQKDFIPAAKDDSKALQPNDGLTLRSGQDGDDYRRDSIERDEKRLAELGRKTVEMFVISHIFCEKLEIAYREAEALKRQDQLIAEEFEMARLEESKAQAKAQADKEKKAKKKEKLKQKKEAEKLKREAEEAERKAREDEVRRQEAERKAKEAEKKRLEEAQAQQLQLQQAQVRKAKGRDEKRPQQQVAQQQQLLVAKAKQVPANLSYQTVQPQATGPSKAIPTPHVHDRVANNLPLLSSIAAAAIADAAVEASQVERPDPRDDTPSGSVSDDEVGTVNQATGAAESSGEEDAEAAAASSAAGGAVGSLTESDGASDTESRAALEEEIIILRAQVVQLQKLLVERDAELFALRAQLAELQPTEIADMVKEVSHAGPTGHPHAPGTAAARPGSSAASSTSSSTMALDGALGTTALVAAGPSSSSVVSRDSAPVVAESSSSAPAASVATPDRGSGRPADRTGKPESMLVSGQRDGLRLEGGSPPSTAAAAAAAAARRIHHQPLVASHDGSTLLHPGAVSARPASAGLTVSGATSAVPTAPAQARSMPAVSSAVQRPAAVHGGNEPPVGLHSPGGAAAPQQPSVGTMGPTAGSSSDGHVGQVMMQRSTSATLPGAASTSATTSATGQYTQLAQHQLVAAAVSVTANGRPRPQSVDAVPGANCATVVTAHTGSKPAAYMSTASVGPSVGAVGPTSNGIGGVLHADGLPSYRNAATGVLSTGQPGATGHSLAPSAAANIVPVSGATMLPVSPNNATGAASSGAHKRVEDGSAAASRVAATAARHMTHPVVAATASSADGAFGGQNARIMMQQAQRASLAFTTPPSVTSVSAKQRMITPTQLDSPGLEDFAHIGLIDDLLTE
ncbi:hypothetical protein VaNZ11_000937 [Volvox africanus]|uniref:MATH domain-containing protein n=1 Tax=Volvox africanus TaxID=51714 RepID=A0ABQ5RPS0_9CHLO|nr:hypothetical protein VaNZ11_000937 [Volvox africanus]